jgi:hypothetical protein
MSTPEADELEVVVAATESAVVEVGPAVVVASAAELLALALVLAESTTPSSKPTPVPT